MFGIIFTVQQLRYVFSWHWIKAQTLHQKIALHDHAIVLLLGKALTDSGLHDVGEDGDYDGHNDNKSGDNDDNRSDDDDKDDNGIYVLLWLLLWLL